MKNDTTIINEFFLNDKFSLKLDNTDCGFDSVTLIYDNKTFINLSGNVLESSQNNKTRVLGSEILYIFLNELEIFIDKIKRFSIATNFSIENFKECSIGHSFKVGNINYELKLTSKKDELIISNSCLIMSLHFNQNNREICLDDLKLKDFINTFEEMLTLSTEYLLFYLSNKISSNRNITKNEINLINKIKKSKYYQEKNEEKHDYFEKNNNNKKFNLFSFLKLKKHKSS